MRVDRQWGWPGTGDAELLLVSERFALHEPVQGYSSISSPILVLACDKVYGLRCIPLALIPGTTGLQGQAQQSKGPGLNDPVTAPSV